MRIHLALLLTIAGMGATEARADQDQGRKLYALIEAGDEFCPDLEARFGIMGAVLYDPSADGEMEKLRAAKQDWFRQFKSVGRTLACRELLDQYGPGNDPQFFEFE